METNSNIDNKYIIEKLDTKAYSENQTDGVWRYVIPDGCQFEIMDIDYRKSNPAGDLTFQSIITPPSPKFYQIMQVYYADGKIKERGKLLGSIAVGVWEYFDAQGNKTIVNEDALFGKFSYNDVVLFMHQKSLIDIYSGKNRERFSLFYNKEEKYWVAALEGTVKEDSYEEYILDGDTGKVLHHEKRKWTYDED